MLPNDCCCSIILCFFSVTIASKINPSSWMGCSFFSFLFYRCTVKIGECINNNHCQAGPGVTRSTKPIDSISKGQISNMLVETPTFDQFSSRLKHEITILPSSHKIGALPPYSTYVGHMCCWCLKLALLRLLLLMMSSCLFVYLFLYRALFLSSTMLQKRRVIDGDKIESHKFCKFAKILLL